MQIETFTHRLGAGWSSPLRAELDSPRTLVVAFGAAEYADEPQALAELAAAFPQSAVVGCSSAGEIREQFVADGSLVAAVVRFARTDLTIASTPIDSVADSAAAGARLGGALAGGPAAPRPRPVRRTDHQRHRPRSRTARVAAAGRDGRGRARR